MLKGLSVAISSLYMSDNASLFQPRISSGKHVVYPDMIHRLQMHAKKTNTSSMPTTTKLFFS